MPHACASLVDALQAVVHVGWQHASVHKEVAAHLQGRTRAKAVLKPFASQSATTEAESAIEEVAAHLQCRRGEAFITLTLMRNATTSVEFKAIELSMVGIRAQRGCCPRVGQEGDAL